MSKIKIITDSGSDITPQQAEKSGIRMLPIMFSFDGETYYKEGIDMSKDDFYKKLSDSENAVPKTTQITPIRYTDAFNEEYDNGYDTLIVVTISSKGSGMYQNAVLSAQEVMDERGGEIIVVDSHGFSCLYGGGVVHAAHMLNDGKSKEEIVSYLEDVYTTMHAYFLVGDMTHLKRGGRINAATFVIANVLDIKPVLAIKDGLVVQDGKLRGSKKLLKKLVEKAKTDGFDLSGKSVFAVHSAQEEKREELISELTSAFENVNTIKLRLGSVIGCHGGPDLVGFVFSDKYNFEDYED